MEAEDFTTEPFLVPVHFQAAITSPETAKKAEFWINKFANSQTKPDVEVGRVSLVIEGDDHFVQVYDETFQPAYWYFKLTKDNLDRVAELSGEPIPASLLLLNLP